MMSTASIKPPTSAKPSQSNNAFSSASTTQALLLEKLNARTSTPDSEALASSDDEGEPRHSEIIQPANPPPKPVRRPSWLNDTSQPISHPRKGSFASSSMSPTASHPSTPSAAEPGAAASWGSHANPAALLTRGPAPPAFHWGTGIWNADRKDASSRLSEVLPSPTSSLAPGAPTNSFFAAESALTQAPQSSREYGGATSQIPFAIPLQPTHKTYRSQSYSAGQLEPDAMLPPTSLLGRTRPHHHPALQHRPSRPSMLSEMSSELGKLKEVDDDDEGNAPDAVRASQVQSAEAKTIEYLTRENAQLRQQQYHAAARHRPRSSTAAAYGIGNGYQLQESVPEESDYAIDELDEATGDPLDATARKGLARRMSEFGAGAFRSPYMPENRKLDNVKKALWQSQPGLGGLGDISQSRRHSFADIPTRQASISSIGDAVAALEGNMSDTQHGHDFSPAFQDNQSFSPSGNPLAASYFGGNLPSGPHGHSQPQPATFVNAYPTPYSTIHSTFGGNRPPSPHRNVYGMAPPRQNQLLHVVLFKCARADVFYIQEGTGLTVKPGDLVIVEADRGTDLGTVARDNVDWQTAKDLKEHYAEEQYKWLMMYSQNAVAAQDGAGAGLLAASSGLQSSAVGGMGPPGQHHMQEPNTGELKPKLIKRLAQSHEVQALREKEGNEAKAKRVCMQKVKEHNLNMEILDAEFQMDWKKLTFYYFADSYINFNSLVTDLFKIYKTRIWMSAINPASFASPTLGLQAPSGIGPGAVGVGRTGQAASERSPNQNSQDQANPLPTNPMPANSMQANPTQAGRSFFGGYSTSFSGERPAPSAGSAFTNPSGHAQFVHGGFGVTQRAAPSMYSPSAAAHTADPYGGSFPGDLHPSRRFISPQPIGVHPHAQTLSPVGAQQDWMASLQGLSLR